MSMQTAPYNDSMRIGSGFNSYTQQLCVNDAVVKDNRGTASDKDLKPKLSQPGDNVSQKVSYTSKFVEHASDVTEAMNISGSLAIKFQGIGVEGSGAYVDSSKVKESDISFFVQVKVVNQHLVADNLTKFNAIANVPAKDNKRFTDIYGDSFVSGFLEGGEFNALLCMKVGDKSKVKDIKGSLSLSLEKAGFGVTGKAEGGYEAKDQASHVETSITVSWTGGGEIRKSSSTGWTIDSMAAAAFGFPERVRRCPQRTHAILTKYTALRSYQSITNKGTPLDYENAGVYTTSLLEAYMDYKEIWRSIQKMTEDHGLNSTILIKRDAADQASKDIQKMKEKFSSLLKGQEPAPTFTHIPDEAYEPTLIGLETARLDCRFQMIRIVEEVDTVSEDPKVAVDPNRVGQFLSPILFRQLLPGVELSPTEEELKDIQKKTADLQEKLDTGLTDSAAKLAATEKKCNELQERLDATPPTAEELKRMQSQLQDAKKELDEGSKTRKRVEDLQKQCNSLEQAPWKLFYLKKDGVYLSDYNKTKSLEDAAVWEIKRRDNDHYSVRNMTTNRYLVCNGELRGTTHVWHETEFPSDNKWQFIVKSAKTPGFYSLCSAVANETVGYNKERNRWNTNDRAELTIIPAKMLYSPDERH